LTECHHVMGYHIKEILLEGFEQYEMLPPQPAPTKVIADLSKVNIFVGANNSGKSRFLRSLAGTQALKFRPNAKVFSAVAEIRSNFETALQSALLKNHVLDADDLMGIVKISPTFDFLEERSEELAKFSGLLGHIMEKHSVQVEESKVVDGFNKTLIDRNAILRDLKEAAQTPRARLSLVMQSLQPRYEFFKLYIPMLRGLRDFPLSAAKDAKSKDIYAERTIADYFPNSKPSAVWTGLTLYEEIKRLLLGSWSDRKKVREFEEFLADTFFDGKAIELIPEYDSTVLGIKIGKEPQLSIQNLGDGIQSLIILTFPLFKHRGSKLLFFCEEPEQNMHPGMQRAFLKLLAGPRFPDYQYFFTTHSNHFLDITADPDFKQVSVYTFTSTLEVSDAPESNARFSIENVSSEASRSLDLLGVRNSSVFLSNCTIWVEGITDRRYFKKHLHLYQETLQPGTPKFREDLHYSFVEYGGACITHWSFLDSEPDPINVERLCGKLLLIADGDTATKWKVSRHEKLEETLKEHYCRLKCKEVENLISPAVLLAVLKNYGETEFQDFKQEDYQGAPLGTFIEASVVKGERKRKGSYADNGTISDKVGFCEKAIEAMKSIADLSPEAQEIGKRLYDFIAEHNK
jgi:AAA ATPase domain